MATSRVNALLLIVLVLSLSLATGCKSGWKMGNPFGHKPKAPSRETPAEIDGIQLSEPPEKYSREFTKSEKKEDEHSLVQSGQYESFPSSDTLEPPQISRVAMSQDGAGGASNGGIPSFTSIADNMTSTSPVPTGSAPAAMPSSFPASGSNLPSAAA
ncbi:MAG: hypothetical protein Q4G68_00825, partial [Planctomycetia bacterium]|nr:hypothetical protein [Planctomycetia bacterium]